MKKNQIIFLLIMLVLVSQGFYSCSKSENQDLSERKSNDAERGVDAEEHARSVMINLEGDSIYSMDETVGYWDFDIEAAKAKFEVTIVGCPPDGALEDFWTEFINDRRCIFWHGGELIGQVKIGENACGDDEGKINDWSIRIAAKAPVPYIVGPKTCWDLVVLQGDGTVDVPLDITFAGEDYLVNSNMDKYNCNLLDSDGNPMITNLVIKLKLNGTVIQTDAMAYTIITGDGTNNCLGDFVYYGNVGYSCGPNTSQSTLQKLHTPLIEGARGPDDFEHIMQSDSFTGNDGVCTFSQIGISSVTNYNLGPGEYTIIVSVNFKGVDSQDFPVTTFGTLTIEFPGGCD